MLNVGIDASRLRYAPTGVGRYTAGLLAPLDAAMPDARFTLFARQMCAVSLPSSRWSIRCDVHPVWSRLPTTLWIHYRLGDLVARTATDVLWAPNTLLPNGLAAEVPCVCTVYDFLHDVMPGDLPPVTRVAYRLWMDADTLAATKTVAISEGTAIRMLKLLGKSPDAIARPPVPKLSSPNNLQSATKRLNAMGVVAPFILGIGTYANRKNLASLVAAVQILKCNGELPDHQLVLVGPKSWNGLNRALKHASRPSWLRSIGFVDDETLSSLYSLTDALVFPSLYEGFGMPVAEARTFGCRVVTTDSPELREAGGAGAVYVDPAPPDIAAGLKRALDGPRPPICEPDCDRNKSAVVMSRILREASRDAPRLKSLAQRSR